MQPSAEGDVDIQIGRAGSFPLLRVSSEVLFRNFKNFHYLPEDFASSDTPYLCIVESNNEEKDFQAWFALMSIIDLFTGDGLRSITFLHL